MVGAADSDRGIRCLYVVEIGILVANGASNGAKATLNEAHSGDVITRIILLAVGKNLEPRRFLKRDNGIVAHTNLGESICTGSDGIPHPYLCATIQWS